MASSFVALDWLVQQVPPDGYVGNGDGSRMYGQGIVTLALAEAYGVETDGVKRERLHAAITRALQVILKAQQVAKDPAHAGGWRYEVNSPDSDLSLSGSMHSRCTLPQHRDDCAGRKRRRGGGVCRPLLSRRSGRIQLSAGARCAPSMTGVGVLSLQLLSPKAETTATTRPESQAGGAVLAKTLVDDATRFSYYSHYYVTQASFQLGGDAWEKVGPSAGKTHRVASRRRRLAKEPERQEPDRVYATAMSLLTLTVPYQILPIYRRWNVIQSRASASSRPLRGRTPALAQSSCDVGCASNRATATIVDLPITPTLFRRV